MLIDFSLDQAEVAIFADDFCIKLLRRQVMEAYVLLGMLGAVLGGMLRIYWLERHSILTDFAAGIVGAILGGQYARWFCLVRPESNFCVWMCAFVGAILALTILRAGLE